MSTCSSIPGANVSMTMGCDAGGTSPEEFINCLLDKSQAFASAQSNSATSIASAAICDAKGTDWQIARSEMASEMTAVEPDIPEVDNVRTIYNAEKDVLIPLLTQQYDDYFNKEHVLVFSPAFHAAAAWMVDVITNGVSGIPELLEEQIYGRVKDRILAEANSANQQIIDSVSSQGWELPTGVAFAGGIASEIAAHRPLGDASIELAVKQIDVQIESVKFAVSEANKVFQSITQNGIDYIAALIRGLDQALRLSEVDPNVKANLINATSNLFGQRIKMDDVRLASLNSYHQRVAGDMELKSSNEVNKMKIINDATGHASEVRKMLAAAALSQMSGIVSSAIAG